MQVAHELGKDLNEVRTWSLNDVMMWLAYFKVKQDREKQANRVREKKSKRS